jgi:hypothetical protein
MTTFLHASSERRREISGELTLRSGERLKADVVVLRDSTVLVALRVPDAAGRDDEPPSLHAATGVSPTGEKFRLLGDFHWTRKTYTTLAEAEPHTEYFGHVSGELQTEVDAVAVHGSEFGVANLICDAALTTETGSGFRRDRLQFDLGGLAVELQQVPDYKAVCAVLQATRGVGVTYTLRFLGDCPRQQEEAVERLCNLLTLATGTLVTWTEQRLARRAITIERLRSAITRGYSPNRLIGEHDAAGLVRFVNQASGVFTRLDRLLPIRKMAHAWCDVSSGAFLETRALTVCSSMDLLTSVIGRAAQWPAGFRTAPYAERLMGALQHLGLTVPAADVHSVTVVRNHVVHSATLGPAPSKSFELIVGLYARMLLAYFGFQGRIRTWPGVPSELSFWEDRDWDRYY